MSNCALTLTTINSPTAAVRKLAEGAVKGGLPFIVAGDTKSPCKFAVDGCEFLSIDEQNRRFPVLGKVLPVRHYCRKNMAYLAAARLGVEWIQETDDDNLPMEAFFGAIPAAQEVEVAESHAPWLNVYALFSREMIWPRGYPLQALHSARSYSSEKRNAPSYILQGLADENPDVDAVYRMTRPLPVRFESRMPVMLAPGTWCPFNSQNTIFRREVFPLLYLPSKCSFRMTDIWRSFVAQRCLWEMGAGVIFHQATVVQDRNEHDLLKDFEDEIPGYLQNERIRTILEQLNLDAADQCRNLRLCYEALVKTGILPGEELPIVDAWIEEVGHE